MSGDHYRCPVPGKGGVRAGVGGRPGAMLRADGTTDAAVIVPAPPRFPAGVEIAAGAGSVRRGQGW